MGRAKTHRVCSFCNKAPQFVLHNDAKSFGISARDCVPVIRTLIPDQPQVRPVYGLAEPMLDATASAEDKNGPHSVLN